MAISICRTLDLAIFERALMPKSTDPTEAHASAMLAEATRLHKAAMGQLHSPHDNPLPRLKKALKLLEDAELLAEDSASYVENETMK